MKMLRYLRMPSTRCLLEAVERLLQSSYGFWMGARIEAGWLYHVHLFQFALKKGILYIHLVEVPPFCRGQRNHGPYRRHLCPRGKGLFVVDAMCLCVSFCYESRFVAVNGGRQCGRGHTTICFEGKNLVWEIWNKIRRERERERGTKMYISISNRYNNEQPTFTKGYKVTLYSDSLRATALYAHYRNGPNLGYQRGQCEYVHYIGIRHSPVMGVYKII